MNVIQLLPLGEVEPALLEAVAQGLKTALGTPCCALGMEPLPFFAYHDERGQYCSTDILRWLLTSRPASEAKLLAVINYDIFNPLFTFVFGEAQLGGRLALFSTFRLRDERYGLQPNARLLHARAAKEAIHEVGHTFGHKHCRAPECVMRFSESVGHIDLKRPALCRSCLAAHQVLTRQGSRGAWPQPAVTPRRR
jgi:archaemetzincin